MVKIQPRQTRAKSQPSTIMSYQNLDTDDVSTHYFPNCRVLANKFRRGRSKA